MENNSEIKREGSTDTCNNVDESSGNYAEQEQNNPQRLHTMRFALYNTPEVTKL